MSDVTEGWYPDPDGKPSERYWNGNNWTEQTRPLVKKTPQPVRLNVDHYPGSTPRFDGFLAWGFIALCVLGALTGWNGWA